MKQQLGQGQVCAGDPTPSLLHFCKWLVLILWYQGPHQPHQSLGVAPPAPAYSGFSLGTPLSQHSL